MGWRDSVPGGLPVAEKNLDLADIYPPEGNPLAGPMFVSEAEKGDTLVVNIHEIFQILKGYLHRA